MHSYGEKIYDESASAEKAYVEKIDAEKISAEKMFEIYFKTGPLVYEICAALPFVIPTEYRQFFHQKEGLPAAEIDSAVHCEIVYVDHSSPVQGQLVYQQGRMTVISHEGRETRLIGGDGALSGVCFELDDAHLRIECRGEGTETAVYLNIDMLELLALDRYLLRRQALVLHSAFIYYEGEAILFTAPSGTGKSTQADLWRQFAGAEVINGDRSVVLYNEERQRFEAAGLPFCGSSGINKVGQFPLKAVVFLDQAPENEAQKMETYRASVRLFGEMSINQWNGDAVQKSLELIDRLTAEVPMIHFACNMDPDAVTCLQEILFQGAQMS